MRRRDGICPACGKQPRKRRPYCPGCEKQSRAQRQAGIKRERRDAVTIESLMPTLRLLCQGYTYKEIAKRTGAEPRSVKSSIRLARLKSGCRNAVHLASWLTEHGYYKSGNGQVATIKNETAVTA